MCFSFLMFFSLVKYSLPFEQKLSVKISKNVTTILNQRAIANFYFKTTNWIYKYTTALHHRKKLTCVQMLQKGIRKRASQTSL